MDDVWHGRINNTIHEDAYTARDSGGSFRSELRISNDDTRPATR